MCGIAGVTYFGADHEVPSLDLLSSMAFRLRHRGPDEYGYYRDRSAGLAHARLSIIDLVSGQQPLSNEDGSLWIVFNGEIFNYVELRENLVDLGHRFRTHSDTEVIVHAFEEWGEECFSRFNGQWAVGLWDSRSGTLTLARDRVGVRPLFVWRGGGRALFASEVKAILADPGAPRAIDAGGLDQTFTYWSPYAPTTCFEGIEQVPAGSIWSVDRAGRWREREYWSPSYERQDGYSGSGTRTGLSSATGKLKELLERATELRMVRADVPVGSYLSGGLDSSLIALLARKYAHGEFRTFSIRFADAEFDETSFQRMLASTLDSIHTEIAVTRGDIARALPAVVQHTEAPILRTAPVPMFLLSGAVREAGIKAVLTGEGADEMLAGYDLFREAKIREFWSRQPDSERRPLLFDRLYPYMVRSPRQTKAFAREFWKRGIDNPSAPDFSHQPRWSTTRALKRFFSAATRADVEGRHLVTPLDSLPGGYGEWDLLGRAQYLEVKTLLSGYLLSSQGDRMLMAHSVEGRFPFLDAEFMEFCNGLPPEYKLLGLDEKHILKRVARGFVPDPIVKRKKQAYRAPDAIAFLTPDRPDYVDEMLSPEAVRAAGMFDPGAVRALHTKCLARYRAEGEATLFSNSDNMALTGILSAQLLYHQVISGLSPNPADNSVAWNVTVDRVTS